MCKYNKIIKLALKEDIGTGDITTGLFVSAGKIFKGALVAKENGILCGVKIAEKVFKMVDKSARVKIHLKDGTKIKKGSGIMTVTGTKKILTAERTALNFIQRLSGIATLTRQFADKIKNKTTKICDTRKTTPGLRLLEKHAVKCGGGKNHRFGLYDAFLIKDNHINAMNPEKMKNLKERVKYARKKYKNLKIEIEAQNIKQVREFLNLGADIIMLDNMKYPEIKKAITLIRKNVSAKKTEVEISGNVTLKTIGRLAALKPDRISVGQLTHSAKSLDFSFEIEKRK